MTIQFQSKIALSMGCLVFSAAAFAGPSDIMVSNNQVSFQYMSTNVDYTETGNGIFGTQTGTLDTETGPVHGFALYASIMKDLLLGNDYIHAEYNHSSGNTTYTGSVQGGTFGSVVDTSSATLINYSARYGKGFVVHDQLMLTPYAELGYHQWDRGVNYGETYTHNYFGIGALGQYSPLNRLVLTANAMFGKTFGSYITVNSGPGLTGFSGALGNSPLYKVGVSADYAVVENFHVNFGIDYTSFKYGMSAVFPVGGGFVAWEPDSKTYYGTVKLGLGYAF